MTQLPFRLPPSFILQSHFNYIIDQRPRIWADLYEFLHVLSVSKTGKFLHAMFLFASLLRVLGRSRHPNLVEIKVIIHFIFRKLYRVDWLGLARNILKVKLNFLLGLAEINFVLPTDPWEISCLTELHLITFDHLIARRIYILLQLRGLLQLAVL